MNNNEELGSMIVEEFLDLHPETAEVFNRHNMACVGCPVAAFYTLKDAAEVYGLDVEVFLSELRGALSGTQRSAPT